MSKNRVIRGTKDFKSGKNIGIVKTSHPAAFNKVRCSACSLGIAILQRNSEGTKVYKCQRCKTEFMMSSI